MCLLSCAFYYASTKLHIISVIRYYLTKKLFKIHITLPLRVLSVSFCLFFGHVATATLPHHKQKSIRQSISKSVSYKFKQFLNLRRNVFFL